MIRLSDDCLSDSDTQSILSILCCCRMEKETIYQKTKFYFLLIPNLTKLYNLMMFTTLISGSKIKDFLKTIPKLAFLFVSQFLARYSYPAKSVVTARFWAGLAYLQNNFPPSSFGRGLAGLCSEIDLRLVFLRWLVITRPDHHSVTVSQKLSNHLSFIIAQCS